MTGSVPPIRKAAGQIALMESRSLANVSALMRHSAHRRGMGRRRPTPPERHGRRPPRTRYRARAGVGPQGTAHGAQALSPEVATRCDPQEERGRRGGDAVRGTADRSFSSFIQSTSYIRPAAPEAKKMRSTNALRGFTLFDGQRPELKSRSGP